MSKKDIFKLVTEGIAKICKNKPIAKRTAKGVKTGVASIFKLGKKTEQVVVKEVKTLCKPKVPRVKIPKGLKNPTGSILKMEERFVANQMSLVRDVVAPEITYAREIIATETKLAKTTEKIVNNPLIRDVKPQTVIQAPKQTELLAELKKGCSGSLSEILELSNKDIIEIYAPYLNYAQKSGLNIALTSLRSNKISVHEFNKIADLISKNGGVPSEELSKVISTIEYLKTKRIPNPDILFVHSLIKDRSVPKDRLAGCYNYIKNVHDSVSLSAMQKNEMIDLLFGNSAKNIPSVFDVLGVESYKNTSGFHRLCTLLGLGKNPPTKTYWRTLPDGSKEKVKGLSDAIIEYFGAKSTAELPAKLNRSLSTMTNKVSAGTIQELPNNVNPFMHFDTKIDAGILERLPNKYINCLQSGNYDIKFLTPAESSALSSKTRAASSASLIDVASNSVYNVELVFKNSETNFADRLLGVYNPVTRKISFNTYSTCGLPIMKDAASIFIGPKNVA